MKENIYTKVLYNCTWYRGYFPNQSNKWGSNCNNIIFFSSGFSFQYNKSGINSSPTDENASTTKYWWKCVRKAIYKTKTETDNIRKILLKYIGYNNKGIYEE